MKVTITTELEIKDDVPIHVALVIIRNLMTQWGTVKCGEQEALDAIRVEEDHPRDGKRLTGGLWRVNLGDKQ